MRTDIEARAALVISPDGHLWAALSDSLDNGLIFTTQATPSNAQDTISKLKPWPWCVIGAVPGMPAGLAELLARRPVLVFWLGPPPAGLPSHAKTFAFSEWKSLAREVDSALKNKAGGMRLSEGRGLRSGDKFIRSEELEAFVGAYPEPIAVPSRGTMQARQAIRSHGLPWKIESGTGRSRLVPAGAEG